LTRNTPRPSNERHPLAEPRFGAAVGLVALGGGIGISLMLAHTLPLLGLIISILAALGVISLYYKSIVRIYKLLANHNIYRTRPHIVEILVALSLVIVLVPLSLSLYFTKMPPDYFTLARLEFSKLQPTIDPNSPRRLMNVILDNGGVLTATHVAMELRGKISDHVPISPAEEKSEMDKLRAAVKRVTASSFFEVLPKKVTMKTIPDLTLSDADIENILHAHLALYFYIVANYDDEALDGKGYWVTEVCGYFVGTFDYWHNCASQPPRIFRVDTPR
jgi:hypothetical protein